MDWWLWLVLGLALVGVEMLTPGGFYFIFFGAAAIAVGAMVAIGAGGTPILQWLLFSIGSVAAMALFRGRLLRAFGPPAGQREVDSLRHEIAILLEDLPANGTGKAELRGTTWSVRNAEARALSAGQRCSVEKVDGLTLWLKAE